MKNFLILRLNIQKQKALLLEKKILHLISRNSWIKVIWIQNQQWHNPMADFVHFFTQNKIFGSQEKYVAAKMEIYLFIKSFILTTIMCFFHSLFSLTASGRSKS